MLTSSPESRYLPKSLIIPVEQILEEHRKTLQKEIKVFLKYGPEVIC
jgi:hypothetical protein